MKMVINKVKQSKESERSERRVMKKREVVNDQFNRYREEKRVVKRKGENEEKKWGWLA